MDSKLNGLSEWLDNGTVVPKGAGGREFESHPGRISLFLFFFKLEITICFLFCVRQKSLHLISKKKTAILRYH